MHCDRKKVVPPLPHLESRINKKIPKLTNKMKEMYITSKQSLLFSTTSPLTHPFTIRYP